MNRAEEVALLVKAQGGNRTAQAALLRSVAAAVHKLARQVGADGSVEHDDLVSVANLAILVAIPKFGGESRFSTFAWTVARRAMIDEMRRMGRGVERDLCAELDGDGELIAMSAVDRIKTLDAPGGAVSTYDDTSSAEAQAIADERSLDVLEALESLTFQERYTVEQSVMADPPMTRGMIAKHLGIAAGTVHMRLKSAIAKLHERLGDEWRP